MIEFEKEKEKRLKKSEENLKELWDTIKWTNTHFVGIPVREEKERCRERIFENDD